jgi:hypothetical protein
LPVFRFVALHLNAIFRFSVSHFPGRACLLFLSVVVLEKLERVWVGVWKGEVMR